MTSQERITLALQHEEADRIAIQDGPWETTIRRWHKEGLPENESPFNFFKYEMINVRADLSFRLSGQTIEDTDEYTIVKNANGVIRKSWKNSTSTPALLGFTITTREAWEEHKPLLKYDDKRVDWENTFTIYNNARKDGHYINYAGAVGYDKWGNIIGPENFLPAMLLDPDWVIDVYMTDIELHIAVVEEMLSRGLKFDGAFLYDDLGYKNGTFFSPGTYRKQLFPAHKRLFNFFNSKGMPVILHSCGNVNAFVPQFIEAGLTCLQPLETKAGMNLIELKKTYGDKLAFMGGIDVRKMSAEDPKVIEDEIKTKISFAKQGGGYIYHSDHSVPDDVSFEQYKRVIELVHKYGSY
jgi:uroporphyrinogen decarboxylase